MCSDIDIVFIGPFQLSPVFQDITLLNDQSLRRLRRVVPHKQYYAGNVFTLCVCLFVTLCPYHNVCPDDISMKDWCHTNNILQVHCWGYIVVQVMFHALMTSSMTSPGHKVSHILKVIYLRQYFS